MRNWINTITEGANTQNRETVTGDDAPRYAFLRELAEAFAAPPPRTFGKRAVDPAAAAASTPAPTPAPAAPGTDPKLDQALEAVRQEVTWMGPEHAADAIAKVAQEHGLNPMTLRRAITPAILRSWQR